MIPRVYYTQTLSSKWMRTHEMFHEADTLSTLLAEQEATKAAKKKFRFVEVVSVKAM